MSLSLIGTVILIWIVLACLVAPLIGRFLAFTLADKDRLALTKRSS